MTTLNEWISQDNRRRAPEFDFGTQWTREHDPDTEWAVTYNTGTGELYARTRSGDDVEVLGQFANPQDVADAVPDWGRRSMQSGSLDWIERHLRSSPAPDRATGNAVYAVALQSNGTAEVLHEPQSVDDMRARLGETLDVVTVHTGRARSERVIMWVDDVGHHKQLPVNVAATQLYGTGWPILGDVVISDDDLRPLSDDVVRQLVPNRDVDGVAVPEHDRDTALDWDDHLNDRERSDFELGLGDEDHLDVEGLQSDPQLDADAAIPQSDRIEPDISSDEMDITR